MGDKPQGWPVVGHSRADGAPADTGVLGRLGDRDLLLGSSTPSAEVAVPGPPTPVAGTEGTGTNLSCR